jgi:HEAT repeat protein
MPDRGKEKPDIETMERNNDIDALMTVFFQEKSYRSMKAAIALGKLGRPVLPRLLEALGNEKNGIRWRAAMALGRMGAPAVDPLITILKDGDASVQIPVIWALAEIGDLRATDALIEILHENPLENCRIMAAAALLKIDDPRGIESVRAACKLAGDTFAGMVMEAYFGT